MADGLFIVFEGGDGSGKSTQSRLLLQRLRRRGYTALLTHEPGGTRLGESLRRLLKSGPGVTPTSELLLFEAARAQLVSTVIRPALASGQVVISDRYTYSTVAYQGFGRGLDLGLVERLNGEATGGLEPDLAILLALPTDVALARIAPNSDNYDEAPREFHRRVLDGYRAQVEADPKRWLVLDASAAKRDVSRQVWEKVQPLL